MYGIGVSPIFGSILVRVLPRWDGGIFTILQIVFTKSDPHYLQISLLERMSISLVLLVTYQHLPFVTCSMFHHTIQTSCLRWVGRLNLCFSFPASSLSLSSTINSGNNQRLYKTITRNCQNLHLKKIHSSTSACYYTLHKLSCLERYLLYEKARDVPRSK